MHAQSRNAGLRNGACIMNASQNFVTPQRQTFTADWHPHLGESLAGFPRCVALPAEAGDELCWPDFATFIEDGDCRQMMYYPSEPSEFSALMIFDKHHSSLLCRFYCDEQAMR